MHTENLHRTLSPQAYASLQDHLRHQAEDERRLALQAFFLAWPRRLVQLAQRMRHPVIHSHALEA